MLPFESESQAPEPVIERPEFVVLEEGRVEKLRTIAMTRVRLPESDEILYRLRTLHENESFGDAFIQIA